MEETGECAQVIPNAVQFGHYRITEQGIRWFIYLRSIHALSSNECSAITKKTEKRKRKNGGWRGIFFPCRLLCKIKPNQYIPLCKTNTVLFRGEFFFSLLTASVKLNQTSIFRYVNQIQCFLPTLQNQKRRWKLFLCYMFVASNRFHCSMSKQNIPLNFD